MHVTSSSVDPFSAEQFIQAICDRLRQQLPDTSGLDSERLGAILLAYYMARLHYYTPWLALATLTCQHDASRRGLEAALEEERQTSLERCTSMRKVCAGGIPVPYEVFDACNRQSCQIEQEMRCGSLNTLFVVALLSRAWSVADDWLFRACGEVQSIGRHVTVFQKSGGRQAVALTDALEHEASVVPGTPDGYIMTLIEQFILTIFRPTA